VVGYYAHQPSETQPPSFPDASYTKVVGKFAAVGLKVKGGDGKKVASALQPFAKSLAVHVLALNPASIERNEKSSKKEEKKSSEEDEDDDEVQSDVLLEQELFGEVRWNSFLAVFVELGLKLIFCFRTCLFPRLFLTNKQLLRKNLDVTLALIHLFAGSLVKELSRRKTISLMKLPSLLVERNNKKAFRNLKLCTKAV